MSNDDHKLDIPCCPELEKDEQCDVIDFRNRLTFQTNVRTRGGAPVNVEVILHTRFTRCSGPMTLGDIVYSTTLLPGEKVRLATTDRRTRFSFDSESKLSYRSEQISEDQYRMTAMRAFMQDYSARDQGSGKTTDKGQWDFHGDASGSIGFFSASADTNARGSHSGESTREYLAEHKMHASSSDHQSVEATRKAHSVSIGEVSSRTHSEGEAQDHFEASSREFSNPNKCHAVTFFFYRINKRETIKFTLEAIERRIIDPVAPVKITNNIGPARGQLTSIPQDLPATAKVRVAADVAANISAVAQPVAAFRLAAGAVEAQPGFDTLQGEPLSKELRKKALDEADRQLVEAGLLDKIGGQVTAETRREFSFERTTSLPTGGVIVKGCMDECNICEPTVEKAIALDLENKRLQNELLKRQIELLDKSQEYRCCPCDKEEDDDND